MTITVGRRGISGTGVISVGQASGVLGGGGNPWGSSVADSSDSAILTGQDKLVAVYDGASYLYFGRTIGIWKLLWVDRTGALLRGDALGTYPVTKASGGPAPFNAPYGYATDRKAGSVSAGTNFTQTADCIFEFVATTKPSASVVQIKFREQDANNCWIVAFDTAGNLALYEDVANTPTLRANAAGVLSNGHRVLITQDGSNFHGYSNGASRWAYTGSNFATATAGQLFTLATGGAVSDLITWPLAVSANVANLLNFFF